jgi:hypothetical protein
MNSRSLVTFGALEGRPNETFERGIDVGVAQKRARVIFANRLVMRTIHDDACSVFGVSTERRRKYSVHDAVETAVVKMY